MEVKSGESPRECPQLSRLAQAKVLQAVIPSLLSIIPGFVARRELERECVHLLGCCHQVWCSKERRMWALGQFHEVLFAAKSQL